jgi:hypothetical protein
MAGAGTAASFGNELRMFAAKLENNRQKVQGRATSIAYHSIVDGSPITGAPGQPVGEYGPGYHPGKIGGALKGSWVIQFEGPYVASISSHLPYAWGIENGIGPYGPLTLRSSVGGFHSLKLTRAAWPRIVRQAMREVNGS